jgi:hypothetical protein
MIRLLLTGLAFTTASTALLVGYTAPAAAKSCSELRSLCWTMRDDKSDCSKPYQRCLSTGTFITPLGRVFKATK